MAVEQQDRAEAFGVLATALVTPVGTEPTLREIVVQATRLVPSRWAAALVAERITPVPATLAATSDERVTDVVARIAAAAGSSPGWSAFDEGALCHVPDLTAETRFGCYPRRVLDETPIRSVLSIPLTGRWGLKGVLTLYGDRAHAFGTAEVERALLLASHAGLALSSADTAETAANLRRALDSSRTIGAAVGILVERHRLTEAWAFDVLRVASQLSNRRVAELADELVATGALPREEVAVRRVDRRRIVGGA